MVTMSRMLIFDDRDFVFTDDIRPDFGPLGDLRAYFEFRTGMLTTFDRLSREWADGVAAVWVPAYLAACVEERHQDIAVNNLPPDDDHFFCVNGRWAYPAMRFDLECGQAIVEEDTGAVIAADLSRDQALSFLENGVLPKEIDIYRYEGQMLINRPWEILSILPTTLLTDILAALPEEEQPVNAEGVVTMGDEPIYVSPDAEVAPTVVLDASHGPIYIAADATIRPGAIIVGPVSIDSGSVVLEHSLIKANTVIGPVCKVAGEVGGTIFQGYSNKSHDGHIGDSIIGEWVNLGAGTTNSNLLNTYGQITMQLRPRAKRERTGMMYLGTIFGDHVKTAIHTRLMTGTSIGTGAMIGTSHPPDTVIPSFCWLTDSWKKAYRFAKFIDVAHVVMGRRDVKLHQATIDRLQVLHEAAMSVY